MTNPTPPDAPEQSRDGLLADQDSCPDCGGPAWVPPAPTAGYQASVPCECKEVGRREIKRRISDAKRQGRW